MDTLHPAKKHSAPSVPFRAAPIKMPANEDTNHSVAYLQENQKREVHTVRKCSLHTRLAELLHIGSLSEKLHCEHDDYVAWHGTNAARDMRTPYQSNNVEERLTFMFKWHCTRNDDSGTSMMSSRSAAAAGLGE
jgi:hypothetical protein